MRYSRYLKLIQIIGIILILVMFILARFSIQHELYNSIVWSIWGLFIATASLIGIIYVDNKEVIEYAQKNNPDFISKVIPTNPKVISLLQYLILVGSLLISIFYGLIPLLEIQK